jgi:hypothetical protein
MGNVKKLNIGISMELNGHHDYRNKIMKDKIGYGKRVVVSTKDSHVGGVVHEIGKGLDR